MKIYRRGFEFLVPTRTPIAMPGPIPRARLPIATPIAHPIAMPKQIQRPMILVSFLPDDSLIKSIYFEVGRPRLADCKSIATSANAPKQTCRYCFFVFASNAATLMH